MTYGYLSHVDPLTFHPDDSNDTTNGFALFLTQLCIILALCQILGQLFKRIGQPAVIGELLAGVLLGPTALGNIPGFTATIVPAPAVSLLRLAAGIGLSLFLFLVGLETDTDLMAKHLKRVTIIFLPGMAIPFAVAVGICKLIYEKEVIGVMAEPPQFTTFFLFIATTMAVTSLSVLSRIMAEMGILSTMLGVSTIAAGVANDLVGYILLALGSALASGGKQIDALWELLTAVAFVLFLWFLVRPAMFWLLRRSEFDINDTESKHNKVPPHMMVIAVVGALVSAFFTDSLGIHPIVGAFSWGVVIPHGAFGLQVTESIEFLSTNILLPLYFVTSGLQTDFKLLNDGTTWGLIVLMLACIFISKFGATAVSARVAGMPWRQACCVASLMQSKGIIEVIILNVGLQMGVVSKKVFAMLFICFICTSMLVRPLSRRIYFSRVDEEESEGTEAPLPPLEERKAPETIQDFPITIAIASLAPSIAAIMTLLQLSGSSDEVSARVVIDLIRLLPQDYTTSDILRLITASDSRRHDDLLLALQTHALLNDVPTSAARSEATTIFSHHHHQSPSAPIDTFPLPSGEMISFLAKCNKKAQARLHSKTDVDAELGCGLALVSWQTTISAGRGPSWLGTAAAAAGLEVGGIDRDAKALPNRLFAETTGDLATGVLVEQHNSAIFKSDSVSKLEEQLRLSSKPRIVVPFFGGRDDRAAVELLQRLSVANRVDGIVLVSGALPRDAADMFVSENAQTQPEAEEHQDTINLETVHQAQAGHHDVRFLFQQSNQASKPRGDVRIASSGLRFVYLPPSERASIRGALDVMLPLLNPQTDFVFVGRGKLAQRPKEFRAEVAALESSARPLSPSAIEELHLIGRSLGAAAEGLLFGGLPTCLLVVQAKREKL